MKKLSVMIIGLCLMMMACAGGKVNTKEEPVTEAPPKVEAPMTNEEACAIAKEMAETMELRLVVNKQTGEFMDYMLKPGECRENVGCVTEEIIDKCGWIGQFFSNSLEEAPTVYLIFAPAVTNDRSNTMWYLHEIMVREPITEGI